MGICTLLSAAFSAEQCVAWAVAVLQSIAMQIAVTGPVFGLFVLSMKLLLSWLLIRGNTLARAVKRKRLLLLRANAVKLRKNKIAAEMQRVATAAVTSIVAKAKADALAKRLAKVHEDEQHLNRLQLKVRVLMHL